MKTTLKSFANVKSRAWENHTRTQDNGINEHWTLKLARLWQNKTKILGKLPELSFRLADCCQETRAMLKHNKTKGKCWDDENVPIMFDFKLKVQNISHHPCITANLGLQENVKIIELRFEMQLYDKNRFSEQVVLMH